MVQNQASSNGQSKSLSIEAAMSKAAFDIVREGLLDKTEIDKLIGVLASNGVYAMWVYATYKIEGIRLLKLINKLSDIFLIGFSSEKFVEYFRNFKKEEEIISGLENKLRELKREDEERKNIEKIIKNKITKFIEQTSEYFQSAANKIHTLMFLKQTTERILIYARYHAKAMGNGEENE